MRGAKNGPNGMFDTTQSEDQNYISVYVSMTQCLAFLFQLQRNDHVIVQLH